MSIFPISKFILSQSGLWLCMFIIFTFWPCKKRCRHFPPGPRGLPLLGNIFDIPVSMEYLTFARWGKKYGDILFVSAPGRKIVILNSARAANDLLDQKSAIYSDRPYIPMIHDANLMNIGYNFAIKPYSREWKLQRRLFTQHINPITVSQSFASKQISSTYRLLYLILTDPNNLKDHIFHCSASIILGIAYGYDIKSSNDPIVKLAEKAVKLGGEGVGIKYLVNIFPAAKYIPAWVPGNRFKPFSRRVSQLHREMIEVNYAESIKRINSGECSPCFVQKALEDLPEAGSDPNALQDIKEVAAQMYQAGVDTTSGALRSLILQLILRPQIQDRAHAELDSVLGSPHSPSFRLPTFEDRPALPYIGSLVKEILRYRPPIPGGLPHFSMEEDEYRGFKIPKGAYVIPNIWGIQRDQSVYSDPETFNPERFIPSKSKPAEPDPVATFGFGRRICPGRVLAENSLWIEIGCILAAFNLSPPQDGNGVHIDIQAAEEPQSGFLLHPGIYDCIIIPRSKYVESIIQQTSDYFV